MQKTLETHQRSQHRRRLVGGTIISLFLSGAVALLAQDRPAVDGQPPSEATTATVATSVEEWTPSRHSGVMVRNAPTPSENTTTTRAPGWVYVKPGAPRPSLAARPEPAPVVRIEPSPVPGGGVVAYLDGQLHVFERATLDPNDPEVKLHCEQEGREPARQ